MELHRLGLGWDLLCSLGVLDGCPLTALTVGKTKLCVAVIRFRGRLAIGWSAAKFGGCRFETG